MSAGPRSSRLRPDGRYLLLSDLHLGDGGPSDLFGNKGRVLTGLLERQLAEGLDGIVLAGDVLDGHQTRRWQHIRRAHGGVIDALGAAARAVPVHLVLGNHDDLRFVKHLLPAVERCTAVELGDEALLVHGHEFDIHFGRGPLEGQGQRALRLHSWFERLTRAPVRLPFCEHDNLANRFAHWVFYRVTMAALRAAQVAAVLGYPGRLRSWAAHHDYWARSQWGDSEALLLPALAALAAGPHRVLIFGHSHQPGLIDGLLTRPTERVSGEPPIAWRSVERRAPAPDEVRGRVLLNLGAWALGHATYAVWQRGGLELRDELAGRSVGEEAYRFALHAREIPGMREWWARYYRGLLRYDTDRVRRDRLPDHAMLGYTRGSRSTNTGGPR